MVSVEEAESIILGNLFKPKVTQVDIEHAAGHVLAEAIEADRDFPPFNRVAMDGIAINFQSFMFGQREFSLEGIQAAGIPSKKLQQENNALEVMTGAMLPEGTDSVIRYEDLDIENGIAKILIDSIEPNQNIHPQGQDCKKGERLLVEGFKISPAEIALLASVGKNQVSVFELPKTAIISTGDELVGVDEQPLPWQIRRSNAYALQAAFQQMGHRADQFHISDNEESLVRELKKIFKNYELIILSGGVSKGKYDFVPKTLEQLGVKKLFHQVSQKPGKPLWFGQSESQTAFALPGNPVSTYMCFYRYIKPWLEKSLGLRSEKSVAMLATDFQFKPTLTYFLQVKTVNEQGKLMAYPHAGGGSGDFANLKDVNGFLELPAHQTEFSAGDIFPFYPFRE
jgi:molybdopterin molybdotransferase